MAKNICSTVVCSRAMGQQTDALNRNFGFDAASVTTPDTVACARGSLRFNTKARERWFQRKNLLHTSNQGNSLP